MPLWFSLLFCIECARALFVATAITERRVRGNSGFFPSNLAGLFCRFVYYKHFLRCVVFLGLSACMMNSEYSAAVREERIIDEETFGLLLNSCSIRVAQCRPGVYSAASHI